MTTLHVWWNKDKAGKALGVLTCQCRVLTHEGLMIKAASDAQLNFHSLSTALSMGQTQAERQRQRQRQRQRRLQWGCFDGGACDRGGECSGSNEGVCGSGVLDNSGG